MLMLPDDLMVSHELNRTFKFPIRGKYLDKYLYNDEETPAWESNTSFEGNKLIIEWPVPSKSGAFGSHGMCVEFMATLFCWLTLEKHLVLDYRG
jgi:hypothetical protein